ncbi:MAG: S8 family peptidase [Anaerolineae bacterium]
MAALVVLCLLQTPLGFMTAAPSQPFVSVIVQADDLGSAVAAIQRVGGHASRDLSVIQAVAARVPVDRLAALNQTPGVKRVWPDATVQSSDSADPGTLYSPVAGGEYKAAGFDLDKVVACDGSRENMDDIPLGSIDPNRFQTYTFVPNLGPANLPAKVGLHLIFKEEDLGQAQAQVLQASTGIWHTFEIDTLSSDNTNIDATLDLSQALVAPEDFAHIEVRFLVSRPGGGEKAEVDCANLHLGAFASGGPDAILAPVAGGEYKAAGFDLDKVVAYDGSKDDLDEIRLNFNDPNELQTYTFTPVVDPDDLPGLIDLHFVFKEKSLGLAQLQVYQTSTSTWHTLAINTLTSNDQFIDTTFDLSEILETPEDLAQVQVRFHASRNDGGEKAEVDLVSLRLAQLAGDLSTVDAAQSLEAIRAAPVWALGNTGAGVGVVVLDSGVKKYKELEKDTHDHKTGLKRGWDVLKNKDDGRKDKNGHGTLVGSVVSNRKQNSHGKYHGVAPNSVVIPVQVLDEEGKGTYSQVIAGIQWAIEHKDEYGIRVMNLSLSAPVRSHYWDDPLNQAVMRAWQAGIVVVVAAGNSGPDPMSIGVPGNNPYAITVGALTDAYTPTDWSDDYIPAFSAAGPTYEGFVKPDLIAPGGHVVGLMSDKSKLAKDHPNKKVDKDYYELSGTSMSAAHVSGVVALMLARKPSLTPDEVKYRLLASAKPAVYPNGEPAFSIWQQGAGRVDAYAAVYGAYSGTANQGLDVSADLAGTQHFGGYTRWDPETNQYYLVDPGGLAWSEAYTWGGGLAWSEAYTWGGGLAWSEAYTWGGGLAWSEVYTWGDGLAWSESVDWSEATVSLDLWLLDE